MSIFFLLKYVHIVAIAASFALFVVRGIWVLRSYPDSQEEWGRAIPIIVDAVVVLSALVMLAILPFKGWPGDWLTVKVALIVVFAVLSLYLFRGARAPVARILVWLSALLVFLFITTIAVLRNPMGIFSIL